MEYNNENDNYQDNTAKREMDIQLQYDVVYLESGVSLA